MKRKILTIGVILIFIGLGFSSANATIIPEKPKDRLVSLIFQTIDLDGSIIEDCVQLTETEATTLQSVLSDFVERLQTSLSEIEIIDNIIEFLKESFGNLFCKIEGILNKVRDRLNRCVVVSYGKSFKLNPLKKSEVKITKKFTSWYYLSRNNLLTGRTIILKPLELKANTMKGTQLGFMTGFFGLYIYIAKNLPQQSFTFFLGTAKRVMGLDFNRPFVTFC